MICKREQNSGGFLFGGDYELTSPDASIVMLRADGSVINKLAKVLFKQPTLQRGGKPSAVEGSGLHTGKTSFETKLICLNEFCPRLQLVKFLRSPASIRCL